MLFKKCGPPVRNPGNGLDPHPRPSRPHFFCLKPHLSENYKKLISAEDKSNKQQNQAADMLFIGNKTKTFPHI